MSDRDYGDEDDHDDRIRVFAGYIERSLAALLSKLARTPPSAAISDRFDPGLFLATFYLPQVWFTFDIGGSLPDGDPGDEHHAALRGP